MENKVLKKEKQDLKERVKKVVSENEEGDKQELIDSLIGSEPLVEPCKEDYDSTSIIREEMAEIAGYRVFLLKEILSLEKDMTRILSKIRQNRHDICQYLIDYEIEPQKVSHDVAQELTLKQVELDKIVFARQKRIDKIQDKADEYRIHYSHLVSILSSFLDAEYLEKKERKDG